MTVALVEYDDAPPEPPQGLKPGERFVKLRSGPRTRAERDEVATNRHGELLAPLIAAVLDEANATPQDLAAIGVGLGPGPFTGLRVGIVTAKAMGDALGIATYGECSLDVIARGYGHDDNRFAVLADARRKQVYWRLYNEIGNPIGDPELSPPDAVAESIRGQAGEVVGAGAQLYRDSFAEFTVIDGHSYPRAAQLGAMVAGRLWTKPASEELRPLYLRRPDAQPPGAPKRVTPV